MLGLQYTIVYHKGSENMAANALSRRPQTLGTLAVISSVQATWLQKIIEGYKTDTAAQAKLAQLAITPASGGDFTLRDGLLRHRGRIWLGNNIPLQTRVTSALHDSPTGGHSGFPVTYQ
jgi:hypothetical protein